jgi:hypothetical protein
LTAVAMVSGTLVWIGRLGFLRRRTAKFLS